VLIIKHLYKFAGVEASPFVKFNVVDVENTSIFSLANFARFAYSSLILPVSFLVK